MYRRGACGALNRMANKGEGSPVCARCKASLDVTGAPQDVDAAGLARAVPRTR